MVNNELQQENEGDYSKYAKCVDVLCGDPGEVSFLNTSATRSEKLTAGRAWTCEPIGKPSPRCSANGVALVNYFGEGMCNSES